VGFGANMAAGCYSALALPTGAICYLLVERFARAQACARRKVAFGGDLENRWRQSSVAVSDGAHITASITMFGGAACHRAGWLLSPRSARVACGSGQSFIHTKRAHSGKLPRASRAMLSRETRFAMALRFSSAS